MRCSTKSINVVSKQCNRMPTVHLTSNSSSLVPITTHIIIATFNFTVEVLRKHRRSKILLFREPLQTNEEFSNFPKGNTNEFYIAGNLKSFFIFHAAAMTYWLRRAWAMVQYLIVFPLKRRKTKLCFFWRKGVFFMGALTGKGEMTVSILGCFES